MARIAGRNGRLYVAVTSGGQAEPVAFLNQWSITFTTPRTDVTSFGDANTVAVTGLPDVQGAFAGYYDDATSQVYSSAVDGIARRFYAYPSTSNNGQYFFGTALFDFNVDVSVAGAATITGSFAAASTVTKVG